MSGHSKSGFDAPAPSGDPGKAGWRANTMRPDRFSGPIPGRLVPTTLGKLRPSAGGELELASVESLAFVPDALPPGVDWREVKAELFDVFAAAIAGLSRVNGLVTLVPNTRVLRQALWLREARISSAIEGIHTTALDMLIAGSAPGAGGGAGSGRPAGEGEHDTALEAWNAVKAVRLGLESDLPFSNELICSMHRALMLGTRGGDKTPGAYRSSQAYIGAPGHPEDARFVPPPAGEVGRCMEALVGFAGADWGAIPSLACVALMHYQFETIHPFRDGNGRIGRALILHQLCQRRLLDLPVVFVSGYFQRRRLEYVDRLFGVSADGDWLGWIRFFVEGVAIQAIQTRVLAERLINLHMGMGARLRERDVQARLFTLLDRLFEHPIVTARSVSELLGVTDPTARKDIALFEELGILRITEDVEWGRAWSAPGVLAIVEASDEEIDGEIDGEIADSALGGP